MRRWRRWTGPGTAQDQVQSAGGSQDRWQELADTAKDETEKQEYQSKADQAGRDADQAAGIISAAKSTIESAVSDRDRAANAAVDRIEEITSSDDLNDGWWDDWGSKLVAAIADIADMISTIAGILAIIVAFIPVVGTALAGVLIVIAAVAAIVSAVANITLAATGERSWAEAGIAIAGAALSLIGLGGAAKAIKGLKGVRCFFGTCFVAGTLVRTADGERAIEEIRAGDKVWARNLETGADELHVVEETFVRQAAELFHLTVAGAVISTTAEHPFMVEGRGWVDAAFLRVGDVLVTLDGTATLDRVEIEAREETVYNFHVETHRNYYVLAGDVPVLVHNANHARAATRTYKAVAERAVGPYRKFTPGKPGDGLTPNHMPQNALLQKGLKDRAGNLVDISMGDGITVVMKHADHKLTRTFCGRGGTPGTNLGDNFQDVLELDIKDLRQIGNTQYGDPAYYDDAARQLIDQWDSFTDASGNAMNLIDGAALKTKLGL